MKRVPSLAGPRAQAGEEGWRLPPVLRVLAVLAIVNYAAGVCIYALLGNYFDYVEPGLASVAWLLAEGRALYNGPQAATQYNFLYGPVLFLVNAGFLKLFGPSLWASKLAACGFALLSVGFLFLAVRRRASGGTALAGAALLVLIYNVIWPFNTFIARGDALILGFVAIGLWGSLLPNPLAAALVLGLAGAGAVDVKVHAAAYFLPAVLLLLEAHGARWALASLLAGLVAAVAPFVLDPAISLRGYVDWLRVGAGPGLGLAVFAIRLQQTLNFLVLPCVMVLLALERPLEAVRRWRRFLWALGIATAAVVVVASHPGAGKVHLAPLAIPMTFWLALELPTGLAWRALATGRSRPGRTRAWVALGIFVLGALTVFPADRRLARLAFPEVRDNAAVEDLRQVLREHPGSSIAMGYGTTEHNYLTWFRPVLVFAGQPYLVDESSMGDLQAAGGDLPDATLQAVAGCRVEIWLIPKGDPPFVLDSSLGHGQLFSERFRQAFLAHTERRAQSRYYDLWFCRR